MGVVWGQAPVPATTVESALKTQRRWSLTTVRTLLGRLVRKGALEQKLDGKRYLYVPRVTMEECVRHESESLWDRALGRAPSATLLHLVQRANLSKAEIQELRRILREKEKSS